MWGFLDPPEFTPAIGRGMLRRFEPEFPGEGGGVGRGLNEPGI